VTPRYIVRRWASAIVGLALTLPGIPAYRATGRALGDTSPSVEAYLDAIRDDPERLEELSTTRSTVSARQCRSSPAFR
jgi:hypothetical protein